MKVSVAEADTGPERFINCDRYEECLERAARGNKVFQCKECPEYHPVPVMISMVDMERSAVLLEFVFNPKFAGKKIGEREFL